ncbi:zinc finger CCCH domain-containing protein 11A [Pelodytes ibericus]
MSKKGDDCYFFFYSTCTKGDSCPFRHCEAALGNETICNLWQDGRCFRQVCKFRHMAIDKKRSEIPCYWENQLSGCQKGNCAFHHYKGRFVDGIFLPPSKTALQISETLETETSPVQLAPNKITVAPTPQLMGVKKMEATENVPSPTHPPVVINAADDDEDDDDQVSEEGDELKSSGQQHMSPNTRQGARVVCTRKAAAPKKVYHAGEGLNYAIKTPEEIKSKKHKAQEHAQHDIVVPYHGGLSEMALPVGRTITFSSINDKCRVGLSLAQRLGKRTEDRNYNPHAVSEEKSPSVKKSLSERLGKRIAPSTKKTEALSKRGHIPMSVKDRLGLPAEENSAETEGAANPTSEFRIKTLKEIRKEKANLKQDTTALPRNSENVRCIQKDASSKSSCTPYIKTFSEIQAEKRLRKIKDGAQKDESKEYKKKKTEDQIKAVPIAHIRVKTLEEIRREKALRLQQAVKPQAEEVTSKPQMPSNNKRDLLILKCPVTVNINSDQGPTEQSTSAIPTDPEMSSGKTCYGITKKTHALVSPKHLQDYQKMETSPTIAPDMEIKPAGNVSTTHTLENAKPGLITLARKPTIDVHENKIKGKPKRNVGPLVPTKSTIKRKGQDSLAVAAVKPLGLPSTSCETEQNSNKSSMTLEPSHLEDPTFTTPSPKRLKESVDTPVPGASCPGTAQAPIASRRISTTSTGRLSTTEDEFDNLIWEISDGKLEAEIDLDPSKDEDELLLELSEMIDS